MAGRRRGRGEGSIYRRKDGRWVGQYEVNAKRRYVYGRTRKEVAEKLNKAIAERDAGLVFDTQNLSLAEYLDRWLDTIRGTLAPNSVRRYEELTRIHIRPALGKAKLSKLEPLRVQSFYSSKLNEGLSAALMREPAAFGKPCSSLDVVGDTELAFDAYLNGDENATYGQKYLYVYGVLQALFIQQDAVRHLCEALGIEVENEPSLKRIRDTRNDASGHPTKRRSGTGATFHQISRVSITQNGFDLMTTGTSGESHIRNVDVPQLISVQRGPIGSILSEVLEKLKREEMDHRKNYRDDKLTEKLPKSLGHTCEKVAEAIRGGLPPQAGERFVHSMMESIVSFESALDARGILQAYEDSIGPVVREAKYALGELRNHFSDTSEPKLNSRDASIFLYFIRSKIEDLITMAKELDEEYATDP